MITLQVEASGGCVSVAVGPPIRLVSAPRGQAVLGFWLPMRPQVRVRPLECSRERIGPVPSGKLGLGGPASPSLYAL